MGKTNNNIKDIIREKYLTTDTTALAASLNMKTDTVRKMANRMGLVKRTIISNAIVNGHKKCSTCGKMLPLSHFPKDKNQPNNYDYRCKKCKYKPKETCPEVSQYNNNSCPKVSHKDTKSMAFGVNKKRNYFKDTIDRDGNKIRVKLCKACLKKKQKHEFYKLNKNDSDDTEKRKNICIACIKNKNKVNNNNGV